MPLFFVHGVNVRKEDPTYDTDTARRTKLLRDVALESLTFEGHSLAAMAIRDVYWGDLGVDFAWKLASVPKVKTVDAFGPLDAGSQSDAVLLESVELIAGAPAVATGTSPAPTAPETPLKRAARSDPVRSIPSGIRRNSMPTTIDRCS